MTEEEIQEKILKCLESEIGNVLMPECSFQGLPFIGLRLRRAMSVFNGRRVFNPRPSLFFHKPYFKSLNNLIHSFSFTLKAHNNALVNSSTIDSSFILSKSAEP